MKFLVKLIEVNETKNQDARDNLYSNCCHVGNDYWLFEGDVFALHEGIIFDVVGEEAIEIYGDLSGSQIKRMVRDVYDVSGKVS